MIRDVNRKSATGQMEDSELDDKEGKKYLKDTTIPQKLKSFFPVFQFFQQKLYPQMRGSWPSE